MNDDLKDWGDIRKQDRELPKVDVLVIPALAIIIIALAVIVVQQYSLIGQYKDAVAILEDGQAFISEQYDDLYRGNVLAREILSEIDMDYIETIPSGVDLRVQLAIEALYQGVE